MANIEQEYIMEKDIDDMTLEELFDVATRELDFLPPLDEVRQAFREMFFYRVLTN
jgi:hypothetical protein